MKTSEKGSSPIPSDISRKKSEMHPNHIQMREISSFLLCKKQNNSSIDKTPSNNYYLALKAHIKDKY
jgi:hypothetical protein